VLSVPLPGGYRLAGEAPPQRVRGGRELRRLSRALVVWFEAARRFGLFEDGDQFAVPCWYDGD
jgi:hypothetical protein